VAGLFHSYLTRLRMNSDSLRGEAMSNSKSRLKTTKGKFIVRFNGLELLALNFSSGRIMFRMKYPWYLWREFWGEWTPTATKFLLNKFPVMCCWVNVLIFLHSQLVVS
jgi:hypothetical protein